MIFKINRIKIYNKKNLINFNYLYQNLYTKISYKKIIFFGLVKLRFYLIKKLFIS